MSSYRNAIKPNKKFNDMVSAMSSRYDKRSLRHLLVSLSKSNSKQSQGLLAVVNHILENQTGSSDEVVANEISPVAPSTVAAAVAKPVPDRLVEVVAPILEAIRSDSDHTCQIGPSHTRVIRLFEMLDKPHFNQYPMP